MTPDSARPSESASGIIQVSGGPDDRAQQQLAALLRFKPSSRDVISGIAPHVFDDQPRHPYRPRRSHSRRASSPGVLRRPPSPNALQHAHPHAKTGRSKTGCSMTMTSPLRVAAVISVDGNAVVSLDEDGHVIQDERDKPVDLALLFSETPSPPSPMPVMPAPQKSQRRSRFRIGVLKTLVLRLK